MKILSIGTEQKLFEQDSRVYNRIKEYTGIDGVEKFYSFVFTKSKTHEKKVDGDFIVVPVIYKYKIFFFFSLSRAIKKEKIQNQKDIIVVAQDAFEIGFFSYLISRLFGYKFVVQIHTDISSKYFWRESVRNFIQFLTAKFVVKRADSIRVVSNKIKNYLIEKVKIDREKIFLAPIFANELSILKAESEVTMNTEKENILLVLCRLEKVKNIPLAIKSFLELVKDKKYQEYKLKIVGSGTQEKYLKEKWGSYENIIFEKYNNYPYEEYRKAKLFLLTSWYEGWGMTPIESVSCGTPVVMTAVGCANEFVFDNLNGFISPSFKYKDFSNTIKKALENYDNFTDDKIKNSLKMLQTKEEYLKTLGQSFAKAKG